MKKFLTILLSLAPLALSSALIASERTAKVTLDNQTNIVLNLYVDKNFACRAETKTTCATNVALGEHYFEAKDSDNEGEANSTHTVTQDETWTVVPE